MFKINDWITTTGVIFFRVTDTLTDGRLSVKSALRTDAPCHFPIETDGKNKDGIFPMRMVTKEEILKKREKIQSDIEKIDEYLKRF